MSDTPRTNALLGQKTAEIGSLGPHNCPEWLVFHARDLERELNQSRKFLRDANRGAEINAHIVNSLTKKLQERTDERNEAIIARKTSAADWLSQVEQANARVSRVLKQAALAEHERVEALAQRDAAREALSRLQAAARFSGEPHQGGGEMKERPILFSGPMVRAILEGRKTQTRRVVDLPRAKDLEFRFDGAWKDGGLESPFQAGEYLHMPFRCIADGDDGWRAESFERVFCPFGVPGDRLWVREIWGHNGCLCCPLHYRASEPDWEMESGDPYWRWRSPMHMPRWASRITLEISEVRVQRLQEISGQDAIAEGIEPHMEVIYDSIVTTFRDYLTGATDRAAYQSFQTLWQSINGPNSWEQNPWVWAVGFRVVEIKKEDK